MDMDAHLRAGAAIYNASEFHAAHDAWEELWLEMDDGPDRDLLQGLIQFTAAVYHADNRNWAGATGLAESGSEYLAGLGTTRHGVALEPIRANLAALNRDPEIIERRPPIRMELQGEPVTVDELPFEAVAIAARVLAEEYDYDETLIEQTIEYGQEDLTAENASSPFVTLLIDFVRGEQRSIIRQRLSEHVDRRNYRESDVDGLFE
jgi:predicted metal-dependent hydrolase